MNITLVKASEVDEILTGSGEKYKNSGPVSTPSLAETPSSGRLAAKIYSAEIAFFTFWSNVTRVDPSSMEMMIFIY